MKHAFDLVSGLYPNRPEWSLPVFDQTFQAQDRKEQRGLAMNFAIPGVWHRIQADLHNFRLSLKKEGPGKFQVE